MKGYIKQTKYKYSNIYIILGTR